MRIGFIGIGHMGAPMALNLVAAGHEVTVYNRSRAKTDALVEDGARLASLIRDRFVRLLARGGDQLDWSAIARLAAEDAAAT